MRISSIIPCVRNANGSGHEQRRQTDGPGKDEVNRMNDFRKTAQEMLEFIRISPTCFHAVANIGRMLEAAGFQQLQEKEEWKLEKGGRYYTERNDSSVIAFVIPEKEVGIRGFHMAAAHSDSPCFKIKEKPELTVEEHYLRLNTEKYGGMLMSTWFDRPLSVAGRVFVRANGAIVEKLVSVDRDLLVIPNVAIHMNRTANDGMKYLANIDTLPLLGGKDSGGILPIVAKAADVAENDILGSDLFLYCRGEGTLLGANEEYILSPKLDDLECACGCLEGFLAAKESGNIAVCCIFDNEEVGSSTKQGAGSTFLRDTLRRIALCLGKDEQELQMMLARSFLVSADNAHAQHPNHGEYADPDNCPYMNEGVVIKFNANQRYATDGRSCAIFRAVCENAGVPTQVMSNRSDLVGGSTLGNLAMAQVSMNCVDIGLPQLAMHSSWETAGVQDYEFLIRAMTEYFGSAL